MSEKTPTRKELEEWSRSCDEHRVIVRNHIFNFCEQLQKRAFVHDRSKYIDPECSAFAKLYPRLKKSTYGSDEYKKLLFELGPALDHHYRENSHHPEHYPDGIMGMNLLDIVEMYFDWVAATKKHNDGDVMKSIDINEKRFELGPVLAAIFRNEVKRSK